MARNTSQPNLRTSQIADNAATRSPSAGKRRRRLLLAAGLAVLVLLVASTATGAATKVYSIVSGDTLNKIAADHGSEVATLVELNGIEDPDLIIAGGDLQVPDGDLTTYTIREGDTLAAIAGEFGVDVLELKAVNQIEDVDMIHPGQALLIYQPVDDDSATDDEELDETGAAEAAGSESSDEATGDQEADESTAGDEDEAAGDDSATDESEDASGEDEAADASDEATDDEEAGDAESTAGSESGRLHLVGADETLAGIAAEFGVTEAQLIAANALESSEIAAGMILKIPVAAAAGVELIGMPTGQEPWPLMSELAAASIATAYWGETVSAEDLLADLAHSENPHLGFRGDPQGMFGTTEDYGVYAGPLADALAARGFIAEAFYADGDASALTARIDSGTPVVVWVTHSLETQERIVVESELGRYSLVPGQHAVVVYGYDDAGVKVMDVAAGASAEWGWDEFMASWSLFDGMGLAIDLQ